MRTNKIVSSPESVRIESCLREAPSLIRSWTKFEPAPGSSKTYRFVIVTFLRGNQILKLYFSSNSFGVLFLNFFFFFLNFYEQCAVIQRNIDTFEPASDTAAADSDRRKLRFLREKIGDEFLSRYAVMGLPRSERILPHIQVKTLF